MSRTRSRQSGLLYPSIFLSLLILINHSTAKVIVAAQWIFCVAFSVSVAVVGAGAVTVAGPPTDFTCVVEPITVSCLSSKGVLYNFRFIYDGR